VWLPFSTPPPLAAPDVLINVLLYVPFGYLYASSRRGRGPGFLRGVILALGLSIVTELTQVYSHARFPSATDVALNAAGASIGLHLARRRVGRFT